MKAYVIDTSVAVKWFGSYEGDAENALSLRRRLLAGDCTITVPELLFYELANALRHNPNFTVRDVKEALDSVFEMGLDVKRADGFITSHAIDIAFRFGVTVYDAYFLALSHAEKKPFVTADYKFMARMKGFKGMVNLSEIVSL